MANQKEKPSNVRVPKGKSPRQLAKRDANIKAAQERLAKLQAKQRAEQEARKAGVAEYQAKQAEAVNQQRYIDAAMNTGPHLILKRWLRDRPATFDRIKRFFDERPHLPQPLAPAVDLPKVA